MNFLLGLMTGTKTIIQYGDHGPRKYACAEMDGPHHYVLDKARVTAAEYMRSIKLAEATNANIAFITILHSTEENAVYELHKKEHGIGGDTQKLTLNL